mgnify:FL=1
MDAECSILVIDDHEMIAQGCQNEFARAGLTWTVSWFRSLRDVVWPAGRALAILDLRLNDGTRPAEVIQELARRSIPVVVYTSGEAPDLIREATATEAVMAIINKTAPAQELIDAIKAALEVRPSASLDWARALEEDENFVGQHLSEREAQVIPLYANGMQASTVARALGLSVNSVNQYVARIKEKYRAAGRLTTNSRVALFKEVARDGLISYYE